MTSPFLCSGLISLLRCESEVSVECSAVTNWPSTLSRPSQDLSCDTLLTVNDEKIVIEHAANVPLESQVAGSMVYHIDGQARVHQHVLKANQAWDRLDHGAAK